MIAQHIASMFCNVCRFLCFSMQMPSIINGDISENLTSVKDGACVQYLAPAVPLLCVQNGWSTVAISSPTKRLI